MPYASMPSLYSRTRARHMNALAIASVVCCRIVELGAQCSTPTEFHQSSPRHRKNPKPASRQDVKGLRSKPFSLNPAPPSNLDSCFFRGLGSRGRGPGRGVDSYHGRYFDIHRLSRGRLVAFGPRVPVTNNRAPSREPRFSMRLLALEANQ